MKKWNGKDREIFLAQASINPIVAVSEESHLSL